MTRHQEIPLQGSSTHFSPKGEYSYRYIPIADSVNMLTVGISLCKYNHASWYRYNILKLQWG